VWLHPVPQHFSDIGSKSTNQVSQQHWEFGFGLKSALTLKDLTFTINTEISGTLRWNAPPSTNNQKYRESVALIEVRFGLGVRSKGAGSIAAGSHPHHPASL
jgi:hypothetical protein